MLHKVLLICFHLCPLVSSFLSWSVPATLLQIVIYSAFPLPLPNTSWITCSLLLSLSLNLSFLRVRVFVFSYPSFALEREDKQRCGELKIPVQEDFAFKTMAFAPIQIFRLLYQCEGVCIVKGSDRCPDTAPLLSLTSRLPVFISFSCLGEKKIAGAAFASHLALEHCDN